VRENHVATVLKPVAISGLTTVTGFASLMLAKNPSLNGLGTVCATGVAWSLIASITVALPLALVLRRLRGPAGGGRLAA
jgi:predicted RND superfamily exporter protein